MSLFKEEEKSTPGRPLADRMRPRDLDEFIGQDHLVGLGKVLRWAIEQDQIRSMIFWGPPGSGKTSLARIVSNRTRAHFLTYSAVLSGIKEIKAVMKEAESYYRATGRRTILFIDEIHRFNKAQQDAFLPYVESGQVILIGATTENPSFEVISPLLSRATVYLFQPLTVEQLSKIIKRALDDAERGLGNEKVKITEEDITKLIVYANGDARTALNALEIAARLTKPDESGWKNITSQAIEEALQQKTLLYDKAGEEHFNLISALHKSMRNSDPDAALYWLGRMLEAGEDPLYVARRLVRFASEDIGLADPQALTLALNATEAVKFIGLPEGKLALAQAAIYLSVAPKSNAVYQAYRDVARDVHHTLNEPVPLHLRNAPTRLMRDLGYGKGYQYAHDYEEKVTSMPCLPESLQGKKYYHPTEQGLEKKINDAIKAIDQQKKS